MACGMIAMQIAGVEVESYDAYEIDKYAIKTATHNFPMIKEHGDVFSADFTQYEDVDFVVGGSPCTHWSIAQTKDRETSVNRDEKGNILLHSSGIGFELFSQYLRAIEEAKPVYFIYENNKSMSKDIRKAITECFGFEPICINSALVSAQNRQRLYWVGKRNADGTYSKVNVEQPADRGILLKDVLDNAVAWRDKAHTIDANYYKGGNFTSPNKQSGQRLMAAEPVCLRYERTEEAKRRRKAYEAHEIKHGYNELNELHPRPDGKSNTLTTVLKDNQIMEPVCVAERGRMYCGQPQHYEARTDGKTNTLTSVEKDNRVAEPITVICQVGATPYAIEFDDDGKPIKAVNADGKEITIYEVRHGKITIKGKQYPIKLRDGYYIIRKLTVSECKRLQTVPESYDFSVVSNSQAYKMLGNGWTCEVIAHLIKACLEPTEHTEETECGEQFCLF